MYSEEPNCPHCGEPVSDLWELDLGDGDVAETDCGHCCEPIEISACLSFTYRAKRVRPLQKIQLSGFTCTICEHEALELRTREPQPSDSFSPDGGWRCATTDIAECLHCGFRHHPEMGGDGVETFIPAEVPPPNKSQLDMMRHALGWPERYRNHYVCDESSDAGRLWEQLIGIGWADKVQMNPTLVGGGGMIYFVSPEGIEALEEIDNESPCSEQAS